MDKAQGHTHTYGRRVHLHQRPEISSHPPKVAFGPVDFANKMGSEERCGSLRVSSEHSAREEHIRHVERRRYVYNNIMTDHFYILSNFKLIIIIYF